MEISLCFLHVGSDVEVPNMMVQSVRHFHPGAHIVQLTDLDSPTALGVSEVRRIGADSTSLMKFRLEAYSEVRLSHPTFFLDTDMLLVKPLVPSDFFGKQVVLLRRSFNVDVHVPQFATNPRGDAIELIEHRGKTLGQMHPFVACFQLVSDTNFWSDCLKRLDELDPKFHVWYGDQEVLRYMATSSKYAPLISEVPESKFACLPEFFSIHSDASIVHFKGKKRKLTMVEWFGRICGAPRQT